MNDPTSDEEYSQERDQGQNQESSSSKTDHRTHRAREEDMAISLVQKGGVYEVQSASGNTYEVDIAKGTCTCPDWQQHKPDNGCKHIRRVDLEIKSGTTPRPDGRLPRPTEISTTTTDDTTIVAADGGISSKVRGDEQFNICMNRIAERARTLEAEIDQHRAELKDLECTLSVIEEFLPEDPPDTQANNTDLVREPSSVVNGDYSQPAD